MKLSSEKRIRPKFLGSISIFCSALLLFGGFFTIGLWLPLLLISVSLLTTKKKNVIDFLPINFFQVSFFLALLVGLFVHLFIGLAWAFSWYIVAFLLSISFKLIRNTVAGLSFISVFFNA